MSKRKIDDNNMIISKRIRLLPSKQQEELFWKSCGVARWTYNYHIRRNNEEYKNNKSYLNSVTIKKEITKLKKTEEYNWLNDVSYQVISEASIDCDKAFKDFFNKKSGKPRFKNKLKSKPSFYVRYDSLKKTSIGFKGEKLGNVKTCGSLPRLPECQRYYSNPRISYDGLNWYLSVGIKIEKENIETTSTVLGIDLGIKELAICSDGYTYKNINKTKEVKRLEKKLKRLQRKLSRRLEANTGKYINVKGKDGEIYKRPVYIRKLEECKNIVKINQAINKIYKKLNNIRINYLHQITREIINRKPKVIVLEKLKISNMVKNRHLSKVISNQKLYEFRRQIEYKAELIGIEVRLVNTFYPSSKTCSRCGHIKRDLKLSDRIYKCPSCGLVIDRDYNAALNLADCYINNHDLVK